MRRILVFVACSAAVIVMAAALHHSGGNAATAAAAAEEKERAPLSAVIVFARPLPESRVSEVDAFQVADPRRLAELEAFFPTYRERPRNNRPAGWITGYTVYFNFPGGDTIGVKVSSNTEDDAQMWVIGSGTFETEGNFARYVETLRPRGDE